MALKIRPIRANPFCFLKKELEMALKSTLGERQSKDMWPLYGISVPLEHLWGCPHCPPLRGDMD